MPLWIQISSGSNEAIYQQIVSQIARAIAKGELPVGQKLPAVRNLAGELVINPNTVVRAYKVLEQQGLVTSKTGSGTFVTDPSMRGRDGGQLNVLGERIDNIITQGLNLGLRSGDLNEMFRARLKRFGRESKEGKHK